MNDFDHNSEVEKVTLNQWSQYESNRSGKISMVESSTNAFENQQAEFNPRRTCIHKCFILYSFIAGLSALLLSLGQFIGKFRFIILCMRYTA